MPDVLVRVDGAGKKFCRSLKKSLWYGVADLSGEIFGRRAGAELRTDEFWAVRDVSFELGRGECLGLMGRNGAGKTTLLRMLNGLIKPNAGRIEMRGRVGGLIALGAGFNPILTGRENILVNASVLGLTRREIDDKIDRIIDFAEIGEFIDMPVQNYSSGMAVRLGFAVATALEPDILILDEVLAVGDATFRSKCYRRITELQQRAAVIFVSHSMDLIERICTRTLVLSKGKSVHLGNVGAGVETYETISAAGAPADPSFLTLAAPVTGFSVEPDGAVVNSGDPAKFVVQVASSAALKSFQLRIYFYNALGAVAADGNFSSEDHRLELGVGDSVWHLEIAAVPLRQGLYKLGFNLLDPRKEVVVWSYKQREIRVVNSYAGGSVDCQVRLSIS